MLMVDKDKRQKLAKNRKLTEELKDKVVMYYNEGHTVASIMELCHLSRASVYKIINERTP